MKWLELHLDTQPAGIEPATELLSEYGIDSLMIDEEATSRTSSKITTSTGTMSTTS